MVKVIEYSRTRDVRDQVNDLKKFLVQSNVKLGEKHTVEIALLLDQIEKLIGFYDTKNIPSRFKSIYQSIYQFLEKNVAMNDIDVLVDKLHSLNDEFKSTISNAEKKSIIFELYFLHIKILFDIYQARTNKHAQQEAQTTFKDEPSTIVSYMTDKQREKYMRYKNDLVKSTSSSEKNKIKAKLNYYLNLAKPDDKQ